MCLSETRAGFVIGLRCLSRPRRSETNWAA
nr:MAG TPA: hypothetical protein [Caudoviricetes sp.]